MDTLYKGRKPFHIRGSLLHSQHRFRIKDLLFGLFAIHRKLLKTNLNGQMGRPAQWHDCVHSNILEEAGKVQVKLTPADQVIGRPGMHSSTFRAYACDLSLGEGALAASTSPRRLGPRQTQNPTPCCHWPSMGCELSLATWRS